MDLDMADYIEAPAPLMFVSFPSAKDPEYAARNPGKGPTGVIITFAKWDWFVEMAPDHTIYCYFYQSVHCKSGR